MNVIALIVLSCVLLAGALFILGGLQRAGALRPQRWTNSGPGYLRMRQQRSGWINPGERLRRFVNHAQLAWFSLLGYRTASNTTYPAELGPRRTRRGAVRRVADSTFGARYLIVKTGAEADGMDVCTVTAGVSDVPIGVCTDQPTSGDNATAELFGPNADTIPMVAAGVIAQDVHVYTAAGGKVQSLPGTAGVYYRVGRSATPCGNANGLVEVAPYSPVRVVIVAKGTSAQNATTNGSDAGTTQTLANALKVSYNALQADYAALALALTFPSEIVYLQA